MRRFAVMEITGVIGEFGMPICNMFIINPETEKPICVLAIIDTGSYYTHIKDECAEHLSLKSELQRTTESPINGTETGNVYKVNISLDGLLFKSIWAASLKNKNYPVDVIIGTELLDGKTFECDWLNKSWRIFW